MEHLILPQDTFVTIDSLFSAISAKDTSLCLHLVNTIDKAELSMIDEDNNTSLLCACEHALTDVCMKMLETPYDCNVMHINNRKSTALMWACCNKMEG
jgi:hypothetical protein